MATSKTLTDFFQPAKRLKADSSSSSSSSSSKASVTVPKLVNTNASSSSTLFKSSDPNIRTSTSSFSSSAGLTADQKLRIEFNKWQAESRRNTRICLDIVSKSTSGEEGLSFVSLEQLLVEETWLEALPGEFQKPYAKELCKFLQSEISGCGDGSVPIYPPLHLIFNAFNTTPFHRVKVVIIGQVLYHFGSMHCSCFVVFFRRSR